ncbi:MAG: tetratricopeptide repeat protein [Deltaproteobacteria bacterium]|nr:tetratricopeptide repeat protein [Deltaproteobacteria bacterium]
MKKFRYILTAGIFLSFILFTDKISPGQIAPNRLFDINMSLSENDIIYFFELSERPVFSLEPYSDGKLSLSFTNTNKPDELITKIEKIQFIILDSTKESENASFMLAPDKPYGKIECAWINEKSMFILRVSYDNDGKKSKDNNNNPEISDIRFGFKESGTRMVIGTDREPHWIIRSFNNKNISLTLDASSENIKTKTYYSEKWLRQAEIKELHDRSSELSIYLQSDPDHAGVFWMPAGRRLVIDLFKVPDNSIIATLSRIDDRVNITGIEKKEDKKAHDENKSIVRMKIERENINASSPLENENPDRKTVATVPEISMDINPSFKGILPDSIDPEVDVENLSPEEAFLYGRIRQAKEINDYDMGIMLSNQFLNRFKESKLCEAISFWRADFYFDQWEKGAKDLGEKVILAYKYAVDRFEDSPDTDLSYIKMAKVASGMDDGYSALGYLGNVIIKKDPDYMPLAYLTRGKVFLQINQPEKAIKDFKILLQDYSNTQYGIEANLWLGNYYHQIGLYEEAEKSLNEIEKRYPGLYFEYPEFIFMSALNYLYLKKYDNARDYLFKAINVGGQQESLDMLLSRIGDTYHNQEKEKEAEKFYRMVIDYYPESEGASIARLRLAEYFSDITILDGISSNSKSNETIGELAMLEKAYQLYENKQYLEAVNALKDLVNKPVQTETRKDAKRLYIISIEKEIERLKDTGLHKDLVYIYEENLNSLNDKIDPEALLAVAEGYKKLGRQEEAVSVYRQIKPYDLNQDRRGDLIYGLADGYIFLGDRNRAISYLEKGKNEKLDQQHLQKINLLLADLYKQNGRNDEAEKLYNLVIQNVSELPAEDIANAYLNLGLTFKARKQYSEARNAFNHSIAIGLDKKTSSSVLRSAYMELGNVLHSEGRHHQAVKAYEKGFSLGIDTEDPEYWETRFRQAMSYLRSGEESKAETLLNDISEGDADSILQQRAQLKLGSLVLARQLKILSMGQK